MPDLAATIGRNLAEIRQRIAEAAARSGRSADDVTLVAVTKYVEADVVRAVVEAGVTVLGESRPQHLWAKAEALADLPIRWHMIGHLQRNKVQRTVRLVKMIESVDSLRLLEAIDAAAAEPECEARVPVLLEVNVSAEQSKYGFEPGQLPGLLEELTNYPNVEVRGLMGMAALEGGLDAAQRDFAALRELRDRLRSACPEGITLDELSMGMSRDYEIAIEQGATIVRVGSAIYDEP